VRKKAAARGEKDEGRSRATKSPTPLLAAVEAAEQAQKLRVVGEELIGVGEGGCQREGESRDGLGDQIGGRGGHIGRKKKIGIDRRRRQRVWAMAHHTRVRAACPLHAATGGVEESPKKPLTKLNRRPRHARTYGSPSIRSTCHVLSTRVNGLFALSIWVGPLEMPSIWLHLSRTDVFKESDMIGPPS
jgi:hypothetical protein